jgi:hypothetical protein
MRHRKRPLSLLIIGIICLILLACLIYFFSPYTNLTFSQNYVSIPFSLDKLIQIPPMIVLFILTAISLFTLGTYTFKSKTHGILIAGLFVTYLLFRLNNLTNPFFLILLLALFFTLEMLVSSRK